MILRRQFHNGFSMNAYYTFSKSIDDAASVGGSGTNTVAQNTFDLAAERGLSVFDVRHRLLINHTYEFPLGPRKRFLNHGGPVAGVFGDWRLSGVTSIQSGIPFTASVRGIRAPSGGLGAYFLRARGGHGFAISLPALGTLDAGLLQHCRVHAAACRRIRKRRPQYHRGAGHYQFQYVAGKDSHDFGEQRAAAGFPVRGQQYLQSSELCRHCDALWMRPITAG